MRVNLIKYDRNINSNSLIPQVCCHWMGRSLSRDMRRNFRQTISAWIGRKQSHPQYWILTYITKGPGFGRLVCSDVWCLLTDPLHPDVLPTRRGLHQPRPTESNAERMQEAGDTTKIQPHLSRWIRIRNHEPDRKGRLSSYCAERRAIWVSGIWLW